VFAVFPGWAVDSSGRLHHHAPPARAHRSVHVTAAADTWGSNRGEIPDPDPDPEVAQQQSFTDALGAILDIANYVGQGLAMTGNPAAGLTLSFFAGEFQKANDAMSGAPGLLDQIAGLLDANKVSLEGDLAKSPIRTYQSWAVDHYDEKWIAEIMGAKSLKRPAIANKIKTLDVFVKAVATDRRRAVRSDAAMRCA
jgi:hypothetical protein